MLCLISLFHATSSCILELADDVSYLFVVATKVDVCFNGGGVHVYGDRIQSMFCNSFNVFSNFDVRFRTLSKLVGDRYQNVLMVVVLKVLKVYRSFKGFRKIVLASWRNVVECFETKSLFFEVIYKRSKIDNG